MIKVAFNVLPLNSGHKTRGIGFYTKNLLEHLKKIPKLQIQEFSFIDEVKDADLVHYPFFDLFQKSLAWKKKFPVVVTVHDVTPLLFPKNYPPGIKGKVNKFLQKISLQNALAIITDSESAKEDIIKYLKIQPKKIYPVYLAPATHFRKINDLKLILIIKEKYNLPDKLAIFVGSVNWNKNILNISEACLQAGVNLVLVGNDFGDRNDLDNPERRSYAEFLRKYANNPMIYTLGFVPDEDLVVIMNLAEVTLLPSFAEGFGLTILESQACHTPVITSNISSMPEVSGEGALFVDPYNIGDIKDAIINVFTNDKLAKSLVKNGLENVHKFSWKKTAEKTMMVYKKVLEK